MIFYFLSSKWMSHYEKTGKPIVEPNVNADSSPRVSDLELIKILSSMSIEASTSKKALAKAENLKKVEDKISHLIKRAKRGTQILMAMPDKAFARRVLAYFDRFLHTDTWNCLKPEVSFTFASRSFDFSPIFWEHGPIKYWSIVGIEGYKPGNPCACKDGRSEDGSCSIEKRSIPGDCLASSLSSADLSSMRKTGWRAAEQLLRATPARIDELSDSLKASTLDDRDDLTSSIARWRPPVVRWRSLQRDSNHPEF
jgi:hypothetical protein